MNESLFDIVIPIGPDDVGVVGPMVDRVKRHVKGYRMIFVLSKTDPQIPETIWVSEETAPFPFAFADVASLCSWLPRRTGWYYQQLLKLYANQGIPTLLPTYLVIDADTNFLKDTTFFEEGLPCYAVGDEYHPPYFQHMLRLHPSFERHGSASGIVHHMLFQQEYVQEIMEVVETYHEKPFWRVFLEAVSDDYVSGASEYELYFHYMRGVHSDNIRIRPLAWRNAGRITKLDIAKGYSYVSIHNYRRGVYVCYPYNKNTEMEHVIMNNSFLELNTFSTHASFFADHPLSEENVLEWMRDRLEDLRDNVVLFVMPDVLVNPNTLSELFRYIWEIEEPITCIRNTDGSENMRVLLVDAIPEVRSTFRQIRTLAELGTGYFNTDRIRTDTDVGEPWWIVDIPNTQKTKGGYLYQVSKFMDIEDSIPHLPPSVQEEFASAAAASVSK